jgi:hypothetical protein
MAPLGLIALMLAVRMGGDLVSSLSFGKLAAPTAAKIQEPLPPTPPPSSAVAQAPAAPASPAPPPKPPEPAPAASPADAKEPAPKEEPSPLSSEAQYGSIRQGMAPVEVSKIVGAEGELIAKGEKSQVIRWPLANGSYFIATFSEGRLQRVTPLRNPAWEAPTRTAKAALAEPGAPEGTGKSVDASARMGATGNTGEKQEPPSDSPEPKAEAVQETTEPPAKPAPKIVGRTSRTDGEADQKPTKGRLYRRPKLPKFTTSLKRGPHDVYFRNIHDYPIRLGVRNGRAGRDMILPPGATATLSLPNGDYALYYLNAESPGELHNAGTVTIATPPDAIVIELGS